MMMRTKLICLCLLFFLILCCDSKNLKEEQGIFGQDNAIWVESKYLRGYKPSNGEKLDIDDLKKLAKLLEKYNIKYIYLFAGPFQRDGRLPRYPFSQTALKSVNLLTHYNPEIKILPWVGGVQNKTVFLGDSLWMSNALSDTKALVNTLEVPGVHVDFEYILKGNSYLDSTTQVEKPGDSLRYALNVNRFHERLRMSLPQKTISSVVVSTAPDTKPWKRKTSFRELKDLVKNIDQLTFLFYDTQINSQEIFKRNCISQLRDIELLKKENPDTEFLLAIGTFINRKELQKYRNMNIENIQNSLKTIRESIVLVNKKEKIIDGIAIYSDWETSTKEWEEFKHYWIYP